MLTLSNIPASAQPDQQFIKNVQTLAFAIQTIYHLQKRLLGSEAENLLAAADSVMDFIESDEAESEEEFEDMSK